MSTKVRARSHGAPVSYCCCWTVGIEPAQRLQIPNQIIEVAVAQTIGPKQRHRRGGPVHHRLHLVLLVSLDPLTRVHDLHREQILVLLHALNRRTAVGRDGDGREPRPKDFCAAANARHQHVARARGADARQIRAEPSTVGVDAMTRRAVRAEHARAILGVAARRIGWQRRSERFQVGEHLPDLAIRCARRRERRHLRRGNAGANGSEQALIGAPRRPHVRDVGAAHALAVGAVTIGAALAEAAHARENRFGIALDRILLRAGRPLGETRGCCHQHQESRGGDRSHGVVFLVLLGLVEYQLHVGLDAQNVGRGG